MWQLNLRFLHNKNKVFQYQLHEDIKVTLKNNHHRHGKWHSDTFMDIHFMIALYLPTIQPAFDPFDILPVLF